MELLWTERVSCQSGRAFSPDVNPARALALNLSPAGNMLSIILGAKVVFIGLFYLLGAAQVSLT